MLTNLSGLTHWVGDRAYHLLCDSNSPLNEVKDALMQFMAYVVKVEEAAKAQADAQAAAQAAQPPVASPTPDIAPEPPKE